MISIPFVSSVCTDTPIPKPWNIGIIVSIFSPGLVGSVILKHCVARALKLRLDNTTPLASPVVPPLYKITASSCFLLFQYNYLCIFYLTL